MRTSRNNNIKGNGGRGRNTPFAKYMQEKLAIAVIIITLALFILIGVIYNLIKNNSEDYNKIVLSQRQADYVSKTIPYKRGDIYDRNGNKVAGSNQVYNLILDPNQMFATEESISPKTVVEPTVSALSDFFGYDAKDLTDTINSRRDSSYVRYARELTYDQKTQFEALIDDLNESYMMSDDENESKKRIRGVWFEDEYKRVYPYNSLGCNIIGFSSADGSSGTGGVEQYYNSTLVGVNGREYGYLDSETNLEKVIKPARNGNSLVLTMDANIQGIVEKYLAEWEETGPESKSAAVVIMNPKNGEVLAMGSTNSFDLNNPRNTDDYTDEEIYAMGLEEAVGVYRRENPDAAKITEEEVPEHFTRDEIMSYGTQVAWNKLWRNICVSDTFEPGSTQKPFTVAGVLEESIDKPTDSFNCTGNVKLSDGVHTWQINCVNRNGHGWLDITGGITNSCNVVMMNLAFNEGIENFVKYQQIFGFGDYTGIDLPAEADTSELVYTADEMGRTSLATNSFGQNYNCTMIQMISAYCSILNGGYYYEPHVVKQVLNADGAVIEDVEPKLVRETVSQATCNYLKQAMFETVETGTGKHAQVEGYHIGGKTGTAQKLPRDARTYVVSFCGFAPVEDPQLVCYVVIDEPGEPGPAQANSAYAQELFAKIMADVLPTINLYPDGVDASDYKAPVTVLPDSEEGMNDIAMGESIAETDENGETINAPAEDTTAGIQPSTAPELNGGADAPDTPTVEGEGFGEAIEDPGDEEIPVDMPPGYSESDYEGSASGGSAASADSEASGASESESSETLPKEAETSDEQ